MKVSIPIAITCLAVSVMLVIFDMDMVPTSGELQPFASMANAQTKSIRSRAAAVTEKSIDSQVNLHRDGSANSHGNHKGMRDYPSNTKRIMAERHGSSFQLRDRENTITKNTGAHVPSKNQIPAIAEVQTPRDERRSVPVSAALLTLLNENELSALGAHEELAIKELGYHALSVSSEPGAILEYTQDVNDTAERSPPNSTASAEKYMVHATRNDSYLRATVGFTRFNQLSFLAAARASEHVDDAGLAKDRQSDNY